MFVGTVLSFLLAAVGTTTVTDAFVPSSPSSPAAFRRPSSTRQHAVSKKDSYSVTLLPGDGIGPEITKATKGVLEAVCQKSGFTMELKEALIGGAAIDECNDPFPKETLDQCLASDSVLLACIGGYKWDNNPRELRPESGLLKMRKEMGLFANLRPAKVIPQLIDASTLKREVVEGVDVMVVRELTGDVYFGTPKGIDVKDGRYQASCRVPFPGHRVIILYANPAIVSETNFSQIIINHFRRPARRVQQHDIQRV